MKTIIKLFLNLLLLFCIITSSKAFELQQLAQQIEEFESEVKNEVVSVVDQLFAKVLNKGIFNT